MFGKHVPVGAVIALGSAVMASTAGAAIIPFGTYTLSNHPDGSATPPPYGLRLDELVDLNPGSKDIFTFDFEHALSDMQLTYDATGIRIFGDAFGGEDIGGAYDPVNSGVWQIDFKYTNIATAPGDDDLISPWSGTPGAGSGTISSLVAAGPLVGLSFTFEDYAKASDSFSFRLGDEDDDQGHRGFNGGVSGWGWVKHSGSAEQEKYSDWLFTIRAEDIPTPGSTLLLAGAGLVVFVRRR